MSYVIVRAVGQLLAEQLSSPGGLVVFADLWNDERHLVRLVVKSADSAKLSGEFEER